MKQRILAFLLAVVLLPGLAQAKVFLVDTNDTLRVVTGSAVTTIHMYASWADMTTTSLTPGASDAQVTTATTTVLVAAPGASTQRQIKGLSIRNAHASSSNVIAVEFFNDTTATQLIQYTLLAGETLQWGEDENFRVIDASGQVKGLVSLATGTNSVGQVTANAGTNLNTSALLTTTAHDAAFGTAGSADSQVRTVQGIASMTPLLVNPGTASNYGVYAEDSVHASGDNIQMVGVVQQSANAALAADGDRTVLQVDANGYLKVVNINPNLAADNSTLSTSKVPVLPGTVSTSAPTWTSGNQSALSLQTDGSVRSAVTNTVTVTASNLDVQIGGSDSLTIGTFPDNEPFNMAQVAGSTAQVATNSMNTTGAGLQAVALSGQCDDTTPTTLTENQFGNVRMNCTDHSLKIDNQSIAGNTISTGVGASGTGTQRVAALLHDGTDTAQVTATAGGSLQVECTSGCGGSGGTSIADDAAFTPGTTSVTPAGAMFDDVTPDSVNEGDAGVVRMSANRNLYTTIRDAAGNERGANVNASNELQVAITANSAVNVAQINGVTPLMGAGNTGTGSPRVTIATDQAALAGMGIYVEDAAETAGGNLSMSGTVRRDTAASSAGTTGDNATLNTDASGLLWTRTIDACSSGAKTFLPISISTATTTEITPSLAGASTNYYVCSLVLVTAAANNVALTDDDTDNCASVTSGLAGGTTAASGFNMAANSGLTFGNGTGSIFKTNGTNRVVCLVTSAATQLSGVMSVVAAP